jgi:hypothetical protein
LEEEERGRVVRCCWRGKGWDMGIVLRLAVVVESLAK